MNEEQNEIIIKRILQVEDEEGIAELVSEFLGMDGITVELAVNYAEAVKALNGEGYSGLREYDALLLDMGFPGNGNGADIARMARGRGYENRIVMFSAGDMKDAREQTQDLDNIGYLKKPFDLDDIIPALQGEYND